MLQIIVFCLALAFRLCTLAISTRHEKNLKSRGAKEYGAANSNVLAVAHAMFYLAALLEGELQRAATDSFFIAGLVLYSASCLVLLFIMRLLGPLWTVRLILAKDHLFVTHRLFRTVRHPNYYLAIIPELVGLAVCMHARYTLVIGGALYACPLYIRIREEDAVMRARFAGY